MFYSHLFVVLDLVVLCVEDDVVVAVVVVVDVVDVVVVVVVSFLLSVSSWMGCLMPVAPASVNEVSLVHSSGQPVCVELGTRRISVMSISRWNLTNTFTYLDTPPSPIYLSIVDV